MHVELGADVAALAQRIALVLDARRDVGRVDGIHAAQSQLAPCVFASHDERVNVHVAGARQTGHANRHTSGGVGSQLRRGDEAEVLARTDFHRAHRLAGAVLAHMLEASQVADVGFGVRVHEHQIRGFNSLRGDHGRRSQNAGDALGVVGLQIARHLAKDVERDLASHQIARSTASVVHVGSGLEHAVADHFAHQGNTFAALLLHLGRNVVFVGVCNLVGQLVQTAVLLERHRHVLGDQGAGAGGNTFGQLVCGGGHNGSVGRVEVGGSGAERQVTAIDHRLAVVLGLLALHAGDAEDFGADGMGEDFAFQFVNAGCGRRRGKGSHDDSYWLTVGDRLEAGQKCFFGSRCGFGFACATLRRHGLFKPFLPAGISLALACGPRIKLRQHR